MIKNLIHWLLEYLDRQEVVDFLIAFKLWVSRIHQIVHRNYTARYGEFNRKVKKSKRSLGGAKEESEWDWRGLPRIPRVFIFFNYFTSTYYVLMLLKNLLPHYFMVVIGWLPLPMAPHCYIFGHFVSHEFLEDNVVAVLILFQLVWRATIYICNRPYVAGLFVFLSMTERDLARFYALVEREGKAAEGVAADGASEGDLEQVRRRNRNHSGSPSTGRKGTLQRLEEADWSSARVERVFRSALCYRIEINSVAHYKLKLNRTPEARKTLRRRVAWLNLFVATTALASCIAIQVHTHLQILSLRRYARIYPGCGHNLSFAPIAGPLNDVSRPLTWHHILSIVWDSFENIILWTESGYALVYVWAVTYSLNYDSNLYCSKLSQKLRRVQSRIVREHYARQAAGLECRAEPSALAKDKKLVHFHHDSDIYQLVVEFQDFFRQIQNVDLLVSDVITSAIAIWVSLFVVIGESASRHKDGLHDPVLIGLVSFIIVLTYTSITVGCFSLVSLHRHCQRDYKTLCSMMALGTSIQKQGLSRLLEFFTTARRSPYTIVHQYPLTGTTYFSTMGWSLSCFLILEGIRKR